MPFRPWSAIGVKSRKERGTVNGSCLFLMVVLILTTACGPKPPMQNADVSLSTPAGDTRPELKPAEPPPPVREEPPAPSRLRILLSSVPLQEQLFRQCFNTRGIEVGATLMPVYFALPPGECGPSEVDTRPSRRADRSRFGSKADNLEELFRNHDSPLARIYLAHPEYVSLILFVIEHQPRRPVFSCDCWQRVKSKEGILALYTGTGPVELQPCLPLLRWISAKISRLRFYGHAYHPLKPLGSPQHQELHTVDSRERLDPSLSTDFVELVERAAIDGDFDAEITVLLEQEIHLERRQIYTQIRNLTFQSRSANPVLATREDRALMLLALFAVNLEQHYERQLTFE